MINYLARKSKTTTDKLSIIATWFAIAFIWILLIVILLNYVYSREITVHNLLLGVSASMMKKFIGAAIMAPLIEELIFRRGVVSLTKHLDSKIWMLPILIVSSTVFGWVHGSFINVYIQGAIGFCIAVVYVKNNYCYWSAVTLHAMWNAVLLITYYSQK
jgi:membrane protease YdiL (CAAX protease family)